jgi:poly(ADP-ribose) glycohydrolase ARH3
MTTFSIPKAAMAGEEYFSRLAGAALGTMIGDALGMPVEGWSAREIKDKYGLLDTYQPGSLPAGSYTDDTQMMIGILETLAQGRGLDPVVLAARFAANFQAWRGYGGRIPGVMGRLAAGIPWDQAGTDSYGNGGAMRVGVLGVFLAHDLDALRRAALDQCRITHHHPQALAGSWALALAVAWACRWGGADKRPDPGQWAFELARQVEEVDAHMADRLRDMPALPKGDLPLAGQLLGRAYARDVRAAETVPAALGAFLAASSAREAVTLAVNLGGDTDTLVAMAGALAGAYWGLAALPRPWIDGLEKGPAGADYLLRLCRRICGIKAIDEPGLSC